MTQNNDGSSQRVTESDLEQPAIIKRDISLEFKSKLRELRDSNERLADLDRVKSEVIFKNKFKQPSSIATKISLKESCNNPDYSPVSQAHSNMPRK